MELTRISAIGTKARALALELDRLVVMLDGLKGEPEAPAPSVSPESEEPEPVAPAPEPVAAYMEIERVKAQPGEPVDVRVFGGTPVAITGFWINLRHKKTVKVVAVELGEFFNEHALKDGARHDSFSFTVREGRTLNSLLIPYLFFNFSAEAGVEGFEKSVMIPPDTVLLTIAFELLAGSKGSYILAGGSSAQEAIANRPSIYTSEVDRNGIHPKIEPGKISVEA